MKRAYIAGSVLLPLLLATTAQARTISYGLAIGNNAPPRASDTPLPILSYADDDAVRYHQFFSRFCERSVLLSVLDEATGRRYPEALAVARVPSLVELRAVVSDLAAGMQADRERGDQPVLYFAFSGHGARGRDGALFLALADAELTRERLYGEVLEKVPAAFVHVFLDACHAEGVVGTRGILGAEVDARTEPVSPQERQRFLETTALARFPHVGVVLATAADQQAHEWSQLESGVFTHELLSALTGAADVNGDGFVEYSEVLAFVASTNRDVADERAVPRVIAAPPRLNPHQPLVALGWQATTAAQLLGESRLGHFYVELESGQRYLDAHLSAGYQARIAIPAGRLFVVAGEQEAEIRPMPSEVVRLEELSWRKRMVATRGSIEATLRRTLFKSAYGPTYYRGFVDSAGLAGVRWEPSELAMRSTARAAPRRPLAIAAWSVGGASLIAAGATGAIAFQAKRDFDATRIERQAAEARDKVIRFSTIAGVMAGVAVTGIVSGWLLWPSTDDWKLDLVVSSDRVVTGLQCRW
ncbi:MAG: caspase family protein [Deltaproteobacteria bacterium]|nr:caspase family protein [Deltaproteobacteria bacterium]